MVTSRHSVLMRAAVALVAAGFIAHAAGGFQFFSRVISIPERGKITGYVLVLGGNRFSFIPPPGWQLKYHANQGTVMLTPPDYAASLSVRILPADPPSPTGSLAESLQTKVLKQFPGARIVSVQPCHLSDFAGLAFELERTAGQGTKWQLACA